ncbi:VOC family protein [Paenibacillus hamazuiensis]|uniref:VOC family protein n=1 Tax=Paenibacillus hamazuiensis TaxID=2936508 RepID=UPI00200FB54D|nr:VOC family protein [Paenibacillus hamazuiensis]
MAETFSSLTVLMVSDLAGSQSFYRDVLGFDVTDWWAERGGLHGVALKLYQAPDVSAVRPNPPAAGHAYAVDVQVYTETWAQLDALYEEFRSKGARISVEPTIYPGGGPWKEFVVEDPDGYHLAFGGTDGRNAMSPIHPKIDAVFLWVRDLDRAVDRYGKLLGLEVKPEQRYGKLHMFRLHDGSAILLDSNGMDNIPVPEQGPVICKFSTMNIDDAHRHALELGFEVVYGIVRYPRVSFFNIRDEEGNIITISQDHNAK